MQGQPVSDAIQALITQLADQLKADADFVVREMREMLRKDNAGTLRFIALSAILQRYFAHKFIHTLV